MSTVIHGFTVVPVKLSVRSNSPHYMYVKEHTVRDTHAGKPKHRTLFVVNVPPYCGKESLTYLFSECGSIEQIHFHSIPTLSVPTVNKSQFFPDVLPVEGYKVAYIVFSVKQSLLNAVNASFTPKLIPSEYLEVTGLKKWCKEYADNKVDVESLESEIETYMKQYDENDARKTESLKQQSLEADDDGWIKVTRHGKVKGNPRTEEHEEYAKEEGKKKRKRGELPNFYSFQVRESKMKHVAKLRQQFKEDKEKVARMKAARKFKPY